MNRTSFKQNIKEAGLTLVEALVVLSVFTVLMLALSDSISSFYAYHSYTLAQTHQVDTGRRGIEAMVRDLREMTYADDGTFPLAVFATHSIGFYSDVDRDDSVEYVEYVLNNNTLSKNIYNASGNPPTYDLGTPDETHIVSEYVQNEAQAVDTFTYFQAAGQPLTATSSVTDVQYIEVELIINVDPIRDPGEFALRSSAALRNLKQN